MTTNRFIKLKFDAYHYVGEGETEPIAKKLGMRNKAVFECIASHQDQNCVSDTTIDQIVELTGIGRTTVVKAVKDLEEFTYEGKPILEKMQFYSGEKKKNIYKILPNLLVSCFNERIEELNSTKIELLNDSNSSKIVLTKEQSSKEINNSKKELEEPIMKNERMTNKEIVSYFKGLLKDKGIDESFKYPQVMSKMKKVEPLFSDLINNEIKRVCEVIAEEYGTGQIKSNLNEYPLNIHVLTRDWVVKKAIEIVKKEKQTESQMAEQTVEATKRQEIALSRIQGILKKKKGGA